MVKQCYKETLKCIKEKLSQYDDCFKFAVITDTHIDNSVAESAQNISEVNSFAKFSCLIHLGDFLNGTLPKAYTISVLNQQLELFKNCVKDNAFFPVQGNHDGYCELTKKYLPNIAIDEDWYNAIEYVNKFENVHIEKNKPYYYVDFPDKKLRLIVLCTFFYNGFYNGTDYKKIYGTDLKQIKWLSEQALDLNSEWKVLIFSHDMPTEDFDEKSPANNTRANGRLLINTVTKKIQERNFALPAWFIGHFHGDCIGKIENINFILTGSQTAYVPQLWNMPQGGYFPKRVLNSRSEDLWDAVVLDEAARKIRLFRFGAGEDREVEY